MIGCGCAVEGSAKLVAGGSAVAGHIALGGAMVICDGMAMAEALLRMEPWELFLKLYEQVGSCWLKRVAVWQLLKLWD